MMMSLSAARRRISVMKQRSNCWHSEPMQRSVRASSLGHRWLFSGSSANSARSPVSVVFSQSLMMLELADLFQPVQHWLVGEVVEFLAAKIIAAALHVADAQLAQMLLEERNVLEEELLLQRLGAGRDDDALARANHRQQIRQRLAGAGAGFDDQVAALFERLLHGFGHLQLPAAKLVGRMRARQQASGTEELVERRQSRGQAADCDGGRHGERILVPIIAVRVTVAAERATVTPP